METVEFQAFPKIPRLNRTVVITEKIDGTNACVGVTDSGKVFAQSRTRIITPDKDNFGFAAYVEENADKFAEILGPGRHFGEWWGRGIQRGYNRPDRYFSLFNTHRWGDVDLTGVPNLTVVPVLDIYDGTHLTIAVQACLRELQDLGSEAAPGFMDPEGVVVYHTASGQMFKATVTGDEKPKGSVEAA